MMEIVNIILSGVIYDMIKSGVKLTYQTVFGGFYGQSMDMENTIYTDFLEQINQKEQLAEKQQITKELLESERISTIFARELYNTNFAKRMDYVLYLIRQGGAYGTQKLNLEYLGEWLGYDSVNELKRYYTNTEEPNYSFIEEIAEHMGVNKSWMKHGMDLYPFKSEAKTYSYAEGLLEDELEGHYAFVIKDCVTRREILVMKKVNDIKYILYPSPIVFHSQVGASGASQLCSTYRFLKGIEEGGGELGNVYVVDEDMFDNLIMGKCYPGIIAKYRGYRYQNILFDFINLDADESARNEYREEYGREFLEAQMIVKNRLA